jgi:hypothetical protein
MKTPFSENSSLQEKKYELKKNRIKSQLSRVTLNIKQNNLT